MVKYGMVADGPVGGMVWYGKVRLFMALQVTVTVSGMNLIIFSCRFSRLFFTASGGCLVAVPTHSRL